MVLTATTVPRHSPLYTLPNCSQQQQGRPAAHLAQVRAPADGHSHRMPYCLNFVTKRTLASAGLGCFSGPTA
ncbi:hypothetical protein HaLaN_24240, partial [Haematococcus lacustris]